MGKFRLRKVVKTLQQDGRQSDVERMLAATPLSALIVRTREGYGCRAGRRKP